MISSEYKVAAPGQGRLRLWFSAWLGEVHTSTGPSTPAARTLMELTSLTMAVCGAIFFTKVFIAFQTLRFAELPPQICDGGVWLSLGRVLLCSTEDIAVGLSCLLLGILAERQLGSRWSRIVFTVISQLCAVLAVAYMVLNAQIFHVLRRFLNVSLFQLAGGFKPERSVREQGTLSLQMAIAIVPLLTLALHWAIARRFPGFWQRLTRMLCRPLRLAALAIAFFIVAQISRACLFGDYPSDFARNPHLLLARSCFGAVAFADGQAADDGDSSDFRPGQALPATQLDRRPRNIIMIVLESTSTPYWQIHGSPQPTTPWMASVHDRSIVFDNFYATATHTIASALPLFGSTYNDPTTLATVVRHPDFPVPAASSWLQRQGYRTHFLGAGGRSVWQDYRNLGSSFLPHGFHLARDGHRHWSGESRPWPFAGEEYMDEALFTDAARVIREAGDQKFFLMLWNYETHYFYPEGYGPRSWNKEHFPAAVAADPEQTETFGRYLRTIWRVDQLIGNLYRQLEELGLAEDTLVVVTADHGESFGQHGLFLHGHSLYEEEIHVPLAFIAPRLAALGPRQKALGSHVDLWPTIADVCGLTADPRWQGRSLFAPLPEEERRAYFYRIEAMGLRQGKHKYIWDHDAEREYLFDLDQDPAEHRNLAKEQSGLCVVLRKRLRDWTIFQRQHVEEMVQAAH